VSEAFVWKVDTTPIITRLYLISGLVNVHILLGGYC